MEEKLKIKLSIADRVYPLTIWPQQEEVLRKAALNIDQLAKQYEQNYAVRDKQDVLAMCALQFATQALNSREEDNGEMSRAIEQIDGIMDRIRVSLGKDTTF